MAAEPYWCKEAPNVPRVWSASSLSTLAECPRRFELRYVRGYEGKGENLDLVFGSVWHSLMEMYYWLREQGETEDEALRFLVPVAMSVPLPLPTRQKQSGKTARSLARSLVWYIDKYGDELDSIVTMADGTKALELHFTFMLDLINPDGEPYRIQGFLDNLREFGGIYATWDYKTTAGSVGDFYTKKFEIDIQNNIYTIGAQMLTDFQFSMFMVDIIGVGVTYTDLVRSSVELSPNQLDEALLDIETYIKQAEAYAEAEYYPKNTSACTFCDFNEICNKDPVVRDNFLNHHFQLNRRTEIA